MDEARAAVLNLALLESTLARPQNAAAYEDADVVRQAATLFWGFAANHAFRDGNKRTATIALRSFLNLNSYDHSLNEDELFQLALAVADGHLPVDSVEEALRPVIAEL